MRNMIVIRTSLVAALVILVHVTANGALLTMEPLAGSSFESPVTSDETTTVDNWLNNDRSKVYNAINNNGFTSAPLGNQVLGLFYYLKVGWVYQILRGTTDANGTVHELTPNEFAGEAITVTCWVGVQDANEWQTDHAKFSIGLRSTDETGRIQDEVTMYTGASGSGVTADRYLDLDLSSGSGGDWVQITNTLWVPKSPVDGAEPLVLAINLIDEGSGKRVVFIDDVQIERFFTDPDTFDTIKVDIGQSGHDGGDVLDSTWNIANAAAAGEVWTRLEWGPEPPPE